LKLKEDMEAVGMKNQNHRGGDAKIDRSMTLTVYHHPFENAMHALTILQEQAMKYPGLTYEDGQGSKRSLPSSPTGVSLTVSKQRQDPPEW
jgi:hypothetical protein